MTDPTSIYRIVNEVQPDEVYNEADQDHVRWSFDLVSYSTDVTANAVMRLCEIIRQINPEIKLFQPCTSNMFGLTDETLLNEESTLNPQSPMQLERLLRITPPVITETSSACSFQRRFFSIMVAATNAGILEPEGY